MPKIELGRVGAVVQPGSGDEYYAAVREIEALGIPTIWITGGPLEGLWQVADVIRNTERARIATGILSVDRFPADDVSVLYEEREHEHPGRFVVGLGGAHGPKPIETLTTYLGALNVPRAPQGHPVLIQAGSSGPGQALAARIADVVFTAQNDPTEARAFYKALKAQVEGFGRHADEVLVMPGVMPVVGRTEAEAQAMFADLNRNIDARQAFTVLSERLGMDMSAYPMDGPVPTPPPTEHLKSRAALLIEMARRDNLTLRELYYRVAAARGHLLLVGTPPQVADVLERWFRVGAADGFNVMPPFFPGQFDAFVDGVVPILQERGLFRADYAGITLRDHLGLKRPVRN